MPKKLELAKALNPEQNMSLPSLPPNILIGPNLIKNTHLRWFKCTIKQIQSQYLLPRYLEIVDT